MEEQIKKAVREIQPELIGAIRELVAIESVESEPLTGAPFGRGPQVALQKALEISERYGFHTKNLEGYIGYATNRPDVSEDYLGIFGHIDVVPLGEGWTFPPLAGEIHESKIYGRGVLDNKGPILSNLFAFAVLKHLDLLGEFPFRIVFGANEETGFDCIKHYLACEAPPKFGWTPDNKWPVVYGERGRAVIQLVNQGNLASFTDFVTEYILSSTPNGKKLGINFSDEHFGEMITRGYQLGVQDEQLFFQFSLSYPTGKTIQQMTSQIQNQLPPTVELKLVHHFDPVLMDLSSYHKEVGLMTQTYEDVIGDRLEPTTTTGGTYAKFVPNIAAYGPSFPGQRDIAHLPDEWLDLKDLELMTEIYALTIYRLIKHWKNIQI